MDHKHDEQIVTAIEPLATRMGELEAVLGPSSAPALRRVQQCLINAMAARDRGDLPSALSQIGAAMGELTALADSLSDPGEAGLMRSVAESFQRALRRGNQSEAKQRAAFMMERSGASERKQPK